MWARVSVYENNATAASGFEAGLEFFDEKLLPIARRTPGWIATFNLATPERDRSITISLWASREQMMASERAAPEVSVTAGRGGRGSAVSVDRYEVTLAEYQDNAALPVKSWPARARVVAADASGSDRAGLGERLPGVGPGRCFSRLPRRPSA